MLGASARAIARTGKFNQASIYYHFGSINEAVLAGLTHMSEERLARSEKRRAEVTSLSALVEVGAELHQEDVASGTIHILSQVMAAAAGDEVLAKEIGQIFQPWIEVVHRSLQRVLGGSPLAAALPLQDLASAVSALFLGIELLGELGSPMGRNESLFTAIAGLARLVEAVLPALPAAPAGVPAVPAVEPITPAVPAVEPITPAVPAVEPVTPAV
ncbi:MAG: TetR/AcrR family transcriptional regulator [Acidimicrobiales bacterium]|nr:TetR/AcrR family transcriptional regulator [Acidimicrobiales bacterium]